MSAQTIKPLDYYNYNAELVPIDAGIGIEWLDDSGKKCVTLPGCFRNGKRVATLEQSSYIGISIGAIHYYAAIRVHDNGWSCDGKGCHMGYGGKNKPQFSGLKIDAQRRLTRLEKDMNGRPIGKIGESTIRFNTEKGAREAAIAIFKRKFSPGWVLESEDCSEKIIAET